MKIAYIGGGSAYAPGVLRAFIGLREVFGGSEVALMDINGPNLEVVRRLGERMAWGAGADLRITATQEGREAVGWLGRGLSQARWSTRFTVGGEDGGEMMAREHERVMGDPAVHGRVKSMFRLARRYGRLPNEYMQYYYYPEETVAEARSAPK